DIISGKSDKPFYIHFENFVYSKWDKEHSFKSFNQTYNYIKKNYPKLDFPLINNEWIESFIKQMEKDNYSLNTLGRRIADFKIFLNWSSKHGYNRNFAYKGFTPPSEKAEDIYLNESELNDLKKLDLSLYPELDESRDLFLLGCWTGFRYADLITLTKENFKGDYIIKTIVKTG
ncbi:unnamed protein product, partial [marine sediment metagenome]